MVILAVVIIFIIMNVVNIDVVDYYFDSTIVLCYTQISAGVKMYRTHKAGILLKSLVYLPPCSATILQSERANEHKGPYSTVKHQERVAG
jgi:cation transport ATPase